MNLVAKKGEDYLLLLSFGSTVWILTSAVNESLSKGLITLFSYFIGQNSKKGALKTFKSGTLVLLILFFSLSIPFLLFPKQLIQLILQKELSLSTMHYLYLGCYWLWLLFLVEGMTFVWGGILISLKETFYLLKSGIVSSSISLCCYYMAFSLGGLGPDKMWLINCPCVALVVLFYIWKVFNLYALKTKDGLWREKNV